MHGCYTEGDEGEGRRCLARAVMRPRCSAAESKEKEVTKGEVYDGKGLAQEQGVDAESEVKYQQSVGGEHK
jgi:hypothetical protein